MRKAVIDYARCRSCLRCIGSCQQEAIVFSAGRVVINSQRCIGCGACLRACPFGAISLRIPEGRSSYSSLRNQVVSLKKEVGDLIRKIEALKPEL
ncbi:MAG: 4Fe-4S binding protein [Candidatus Omnitrophica bacterium]|nr:4Fe-4S binding protein [Candidatus Omnitrophota bacterium]